jgi:chaperone modulatory protein CbpM
MKNEMIHTEVGIIVEESDQLSFVSLCRYCALPTKTVIKMVNRGIIEPVNPSQSYSQWQFTRLALLRVQTALRLQRDLDVNLAGAVLAIELLDEIKQLRQQLGALKKQE